VGSEYTGELCGAKVLTWLYELMVFALGSDAGEFHGVEVWAESMKVSFQYVDWGQW
jgi:hypothetical protein